MKLFYSHTQGFWVRVKGQSAPNEKNCKEYGRLSRPESYISEMNLEIFGVYIFFCYHFSPGNYSETIIFKKKCCGNKLLSFLQNFHTCISYNTV